MSTECLSCLGGPDVMRAAIGAGSEAVGIEVGVARRSVSGAVAEHASGTSGGKGEAATNSASCCSRPAAPSCGKRGSHLSPSGRSSAGWRRTRAFGSPMDPSSGGYGRTRPISEPTYWWPSHWNRTKARSIAPLPQSCRRCQDGSQHAGVSDRSNARALPARRCGQLAGHARRGQLALWIGAWGLILSNEPLEYRKRIEAALVAGHDAFNERIERCTSP